MKNIEKYRNVVLENLNICRLETSLRELYEEKVVCCPHTNCDECKKRFREWLLEEDKEPILNGTEKEYLSAVIKPFRNKIATISKLHTYDNINYENNEYIYFGMKDRRGYSLPLFKQGTMYKGMQQGKHYTLQELGL